MLFVGFQFAPRWKRRGKARRLESEVRFASAEKQAAFADELTIELQRLLAKYHEESAPGGRRFQVLGGAGKARPFASARATETFLKEPSSLRPARNLVITVETWNRALLRLRHEDLYGRREAHLWLSPCCLPRERAAEFQTRWQGELESLLSA